ncbi:MAG: hypothetical protein HGA85_07195, partial [Nanoarchaeota archaeon]|nr:hypothetical protein [Nanoarchaeota archaeon]
RQDYYIVEFEDGSRLEVTDEHPIFIKNSLYTGWASIRPESTYADASMNVAKLAVGDSVLDKDRDWVEVVSITHICKAVQTYNLKRVSLKNTFFAGGMLVHNKGGSCFLPGTLVRMSDGSEKKIEDVKVGDDVLGYDIEKKAYFSNKVLELESPVRYDYYTLTFSDGSALKLTDEHPVYIRSSDSEGWASISPMSTFDDARMKVMKISIGDKVYQADGSWETIVSIDHTVEEVQTYNLKSVSGTNTFFAEGVLVHNKGDGPPPPPPPKCGDNSWNAGTDKACEYAASPQIFNNNGQYTGTICQANGQACRSGAEECTCCGDSVIQASELCDLGSSNGEDRNNDDIITEGECRTDCTFCGDGVLQAAKEKCDLASNNGIDLNQDGYFGSGECRIDCTFCGDGMHQPDEFCDPELACPLAGGCTQANYNEWKDSGYYPSCRRDCTACGDGILQIGESCDDTRAYPMQLHTMFSPGQYVNTCPGSCTQPAWISGDRANQCDCKPEACDQTENNGKCTHCVTNKDLHPYFEKLCNGSTSLWNLDTDRNSNDIPCDCCKCCLPGETGAGCCGEGVCPEGLQYFCDGGVDDGFSWSLISGTPVLSSAVLSSSPTDMGGRDVLPQFLNCSDNDTVQLVEYPKYVYLTWQDVTGGLFRNDVEETQSLSSIKFSMIYKSFHTSIGVEWYDAAQGAWKPVPGCGPFISEEKESVYCTLPAALVQQIWTDTLPREDNVILRLVINKIEVMR